MFFVHSNTLAELLFSAQICDFELLASVHAHERSQSRHIQDKHRPRLLQPANLQNDFGDAARLACAWREAKDLSPLAQRRRELM